MAKIFCKCGCGRETHNGKKFIHSHNLRVLKRKSHSEKTKKKMSKRKLENPTLYWKGKTRIEDVKKKISDTLKRKIKSGKIKNCSVYLMKYQKENGVWNKGKEWNEETKKKMSISAVKRISKNKGKQTKIELNMQKRLNNLKIVFTPQANIGNIFVADFILKNRNTLIECDGDYWHSRKDNILKDKKKNGFYKKLGFRFLRFREKDINNPNFDVGFFIKMEEIRNLYYDYENKCYCWELVFLGKVEENFERTAKAVEELNKRLKE